MTADIKIPDSLPWRANEDGPGNIRDAAGECLSNVDDIAECVAYIVHAANHYPALVEALKAVRAEFRVETMDDGRHAGVAHDSDALPRIVARLDAALQAAGVKI